MKSYLLFFVFLMVMALLNYYSYKRFLLKLHPPFNRFAFVLPLLLMLIEGLFVFEILTEMLPESTLLYLILSASVGITFVLFVVASFYDLNIQLFKRLPYQENRRRFIKITFDVTMIILAVSYLFKGLKSGLSMPILNSVDVSIKNFALDEFVIIQLSDVHIGRTITTSFVRSIVKSVNAQQPDLVVLTGDIIDLNVEKIKTSLAPLGDIQAPCYFILGNHEYFHNPDDAIKHMQSLGIHVLVNEHVQIGEHFNLIGLSDIIGERLGIYPMDIPKAYAGINPQLPSIVLAHQPKSILALEKRPCDLMLSGHTHGGQIFPFGLLVMAAQPYLAGLYQHTKDQQIFVSRGTGYWGPPIRIMAPSEITKITLRPSR